MPKMNFPGPYEIRLYYTTTPTGMPSFQHIARYNINLTAAPSPGTTFNLLTVVPNGGAPTTLQAYIDAWVLLVKAAMSSNANNTIDFAELWAYTPLSFEASFVSAYSIAAAGTVGSAATPANEQIITYRTAEGGIMRQHFLEFAAQGTAVPDTPPFTSASFDAIRTFVTSVNNAWLGRDTSYPFATIAKYAGENEKLFKKRFRP